MIIVLYFLKTILISGLLFGYYCLCQRNKVFHQYNRWFLLAIPAVSLILPLLRLNIPDFLSKSRDGGTIHLLGVADDNLEEAVTIYTHQGFWRTFPWESVFLALVLLVSLCFLFRFLSSLWQIRFLRHNNSSREIEGTRIYFVVQEATPFSFFKSIFWNEAVALDSPQGQQILRHELYHAQHWHSMDVLLLEIARILCWFNPFIHLIRKEIQTIHEFSADEFASLETDKLEYAEMLLINSFRPKNISITHSFFKNQIKRRIVMITQNKKNKSGLLGRIMILPLVVMLLGLFAFRFQNHSLLSVAKTKTIRVIIDAGHGGIYPGVQANGFREKDINLQIAKKIEQMAKDYQIEVFMTRETDGIPGEFGNLADDLHYRAALAAKENADLFVSIHINSNEKISQSPGSGFEIYVPKNTSVVYSGSVKLGSSISEFIRKDYIIGPELKQSEVGVLVLDKATVPAIIIECGFIDNKTDVDFITNNKNQDKIVQDILEGIRKYEANESSLQENPDSNTFTVTADTIIINVLKAKDPNTMYSVNIDKTDNRMYVKYKNRKEAIGLITKELRMTFDTASVYKR
jgi:N-acetylmuramoyl-L-alanine amidase